MNSKEIDELLNKYALLKMEKLNKEQEFDLYREGDEEDLISEFLGDRYGYNEDEDKEFFELTGVKLEVVHHNYDYNGEGASYYVVIKIDGKFYRKDGYWDSYDGANLDGEWVEVVPVDVTKIERHFVSETEIDSSMKKVKLQKRSKK